MFIPRFVESPLKCDEKIKVIIQLVVAVVQVLFVEKTSSKKSRD